VLSPNGKVAAEDLSPNKLKLEPVEDGYVVHNVTGIRTHVVRRLDGKGYDIRKIGHYTIRAGQMVYINDSSLLLETSTSQMEHFGSIQLRFYIDAVDSMFSRLNMMETVNDMDLSVTGYVGFFGGNLLNSEELPVLFTGLIPVYQDDENTYGCEAYHESYQDGIILTQRGECTFLQKLIQARDSGAAGVLVVNDEDFAINPTSHPEELEAAGDISEVAIIMLPRTAGQQIEDLLNNAQGIGHVMFSLEHEHQSAVEAKIEAEIQEKNPRILYINGHPLLNTRLLF